jgi:hypothetical protein
VDVVPATVTEYLCRASTAASGLMAAVVIATSACSTSAPAEPTRATGALSHTFESADALARSLLDALRQNDLARLRALPLSEAEFRDHVWPELPTSRPERNVPFEYAWGQMKQHSDGSMQQTMARYAGKRLTLIRTRFTGETTQYQSFAVMRESEIIASDETGRELVLRLYGSALVKDGRYKLFSYVVDE